VANELQETNKQRRRSTCPINFALETFGDTWSFLIIRDIVYFGKRTFSEFASSGEGISSNILANRLARLEQEGILVKTPHQTDRRREVYSLTEKGLDLIPILMEMANWSATHDPETTAPLDFVARVNADKEKLFRLIRETVQAGGAVFVGPESVVEKLSARSS
jgi:DNA-binding HxlR family transcriptional regulator